MNFFETFVSKEAIKLVNDCMETERLSAGKMADQFERDLITTLGVSNPVTVNSGTSALHLALVLAGVKPGDEVLLPAQTFLATGTAILYAGAIPVFCDINPDDGCISVDDVRKKITKKTKAIMCVDWAGYPCDLSALMYFSYVYGIKVIEDAAHSIGAIYRDKPVGSWADFTCFSFQAIKHLTTGDGGAVCCLDPDDVVKARNLRWFDIDREHSNADILGEMVYDATHLGFKYHMNDFAASMGIGNLPHLKENLTRTRAIAGWYNEQLKDVQDIQLMKYDADRTSSYWLYPIRVQNRERFIALLKANGIPTSVVHLGIDKNSIFGGKQESLIGQRFFDKYQVHLPINYKLTFEDIHNIVTTIKKGW